MWSYCTKLGTVGIQKTIYAIYYYTFIKLGELHK